MKKRQLMIIGSTILILLIGYAGMKLLASQKKEPQKKEAKGSIRAVKSLRVELDTIPMKFPIQGRIVAGRRLEIYSEVTGRLLPTNKPFKVGTPYKSGDILLSIDGEESLLALKAQRSAFMNVVAQVLPDIKIDYEESFDEWSNFLQKIDPEQNLPKIPLVNNTKLKNLLSGRNIYQQYYTIQSLEHRQSKFTITTPFDGILSQGDLNAGTLIRAGQKMGELMSDRGYEFQGALAISDAERIKVGDGIILASGIEGSISRISLNADPNTQQITIYASITTNSSSEGAYMDGFIYSEDILDAVQIDRNLILPNNTLYFISDSTLSLKTVDVVHMYEKTAIIKGVNNGELILNQTIEGGFEGQKVKPIVK